ncbi:50S ribosome-binding GTPase, partial [Methanothermococcus sp. SCGC AD-155-M21]|nr:50S ribosome-binding GTPase [Methanothermococcus sp. SCGC AD-155-M21]
MEVKGFEELKKTFELNKKNNINKDNPQVIVVGRSNVGKSTLVRLITKK